MKRRYFGTDGIRGRAGKFPLDPPTVHALGQSAGSILGGSGASVLVGMDPRESSAWIAASLMDGFKKAGVDCHFAGVVPTPAVAKLCADRAYTFGAMISASHNPYEDNGIKLFSGAGYKLPDETEHHIEVAMDGLRGVGSAGAHAAPDRPSGEHAEDYLRWLTSLWRGSDLTGIRLVVDGANGAASELAPRLFENLGADVDKVACSPDGRNINRECGSLHADRLAALVIGSGADMGFAFDGDADRCMAVTEKGQILDGDYILYREAQRRAATGELSGRWVVGTVMSNLWLERALENENLGFFRAPVGDRYVLQCLQERGGELGGEPSGHILFLDKTTTGDGLVTAMTYAMLARDAGSMDALADGIHPYPQVLVNLRVGERLPLEEQPAISAALEQETARLGDKGRIILRYSGTEPLLRLMVEAETHGDVDRVLSRLTGVLLETLGEG